MQLLVHWGRGKLAEQLANEFALKFPKSKKQLFLLAIAYRAQGQYLKASRTFSDYFKHYPASFSEFAPYVNILKKMGALYKDRLLQFYDSLISFNEAPSSAYLSYGEYLYSEEGEASKAIDIFRRGLEKYQTSEELLHWSYKLAIITGDEEFSTQLRVQMDDLGISYVDAHKLIEGKDTGDSEKNRDINCKELIDCIITEPKIDPSIIDVEETLVDIDISDGDRPIALFAYARPRPNLDVIYYMYKLLRDRGYAAYVFLHKGDIELFDFTEVPVKEDDIFYAVWPEYFNADSKFSCIISNDMCQISAKNLTNGCKLVFHAPHNTNSPADHQNSLAAHYATYINTKEPPVITKEHFKLTPLQECRHTKFIYEK